MKGNLTFNTIPIKFCAMVEQYRLELAKKSPIDLQLDVSLPWITICWIHESVLISKKFWFIQWLVKKDKISHFKVDRKMIDSLWRYHWKETTINMVWNNLDKVLIILLSISETPIEDLISYLK